MGISLSVIVYNYSHLRFCCVCSWSPVFMEVVHCGWLSVKRGIRIYSLPDFLSEREVIFEFRGRSRRLVPLAKMEIYNFIR
jgi:hypothetical protein